MPSRVASEQLAISDWVKNLAAIPANDFSLENVQDFVMRHHVRPDTLDKYLYFSKGCYTRNLIFKNDLFECMTICWEVGQFSRIHNHRDQNCWMSRPSAGSSAEFPRRRPPRFRRPFRYVSPRRDRHLRNELLKSRLRQSPRTRAPGSQSRRIQSTRRQRSHLLQAIRLLRSLPTRKGNLRRRTPPLHQ